MKDGIIIKIIKFFDRSIYAIDLKVSRFIRSISITKRYNLVGKCSRCGACCITPSIHVGKMIWNFKPFESAFLGWQKYINGFELFEKEEESRLYVFNCTHFDAKTRSCDSYSSRPGLCRDYPKILTFEVCPIFFESCTMKAYDPKAEDLLNKLDSEKLTDEQMKILKKELYLEK